MSGTHRKQQISQPAGHGRFFFGEGRYSDIVPRSYTVEQETWSWNHPSYRESLGKGDVGGPFRTRKTFFAESPQEFRAQGFGRVYEGTLHVFHAQFSPSATSNFTPKPSSFDDMVRDGATGIARTTPTSPSFSLANAAGELYRDGIPAAIGSGLLKSRARDLRKAGDEYLNVEFGWKPLMADLRNFAKSVKGHNARLAQARRDSGKTVRARIALSGEKTSSTPSAYAAGWLGPQDCGGGVLDAWMMGDPIANQGYSSWSESTRKKWFSGAYTYYLPEPGNGALDRMLSYESNANLILGTRLTPEVVWNLAPWSWAADWFSNAGDVFHNVSQFTGPESLALKWGYVMEEASEASVTHYQGRINTPVGPQVINLTARQGGVVKSRFQAFPYGFGLSFDAMSVRQMAITAALGISHAPHVSL